MNVVQLNEKPLGAFLLALVVSAMLVACSSTDEASQPEDTSSSCAEQCANQEPLNQDECIILCGA
jgi:hypothetical protein